MPPPFGPNTLSEEQGTSHVHLHCVQTDSTTIQPPDTRQQDRAIQYPYDPNTIHQVSNIQYTSLTWTCGHGRSHHPHEFHKHDSPRTHVNEPVLCLRSRTLRQASSHAAAAVLSPPSHRRAPRPLLLPPLMTPQLLPPSLLCATATTHCRATAHWPLLPLPSLLYCRRGVRRRGRAIAHKPQPLLERPCRCT